VNVLVEINITFILDSWLIALNLFDFIHMPIKNCSINNTRESDCWEIMVQYYIHWQFYIQEVPVEWVIVYYIVYNNNTWQTS